MADVYKMVTDKIIKELGIDFSKVKISRDSGNYTKIDENIGTFQRIAREIKGTIIIKGEYDLIVNSKSFKINKTGNPGMTVGGTGDALAGLAASLFSQGLGAFDAAVVAVYINGRAGDVAYNKQGYGFSATDLVSYIGSLLVSRW